MPWGECRLPSQPVDPAVGNDVQRVVRARPQWLSRLGRVPWVARGMARMSAYPVLHAERSLCDEVGLVVSRENSCRYCYGVQRALLKIGGQRDRDIDALERRFELLPLDAEHRLALETARRIARAESRPSAAELSTLAAKLGQKALTELVYVTAAAGFSNRVATFLLLPPETGMEGAGEKPWLRWLAKHRLLRRPVPPPLEDAGDGPCAAVLAPLVGFPCGTYLATTAREAYAPSHLPARTKLLMTAVVGRALGCPIAEQDTSAQLEEEGVAADERERIVAHLGQRTVDQREAALLGFARDSVRYRFDAMQRTLEQLQPLLTPAEFIEAVGIASLANVVCRLSVLAGAC